MNCDYLVVGAGFFGGVIAERIANELGRKVLLIDKRPHIGGNCYSETDADTGIETHKYGTHIFHTSEPEAWDYLKRFTELNGYYHQVLTTYKNKVYQMPINLETINSFYNLNLKPYEAKKFIASEISKEGISRPRNLEEKAISLIGRPLYEAFIKGYTIKQWRKDPTELPAEIITRLPVRFNYQETYFVNARWQGIPLNGFTEVFEKMLASPNIKLELNCDYFEHRDDFKVACQTIYTGPLDQFFAYRFGKLEWRTVNFKKEVKPVEDYQGTSVMNFADPEAEYTRVHEPRHLHPERSYSREKTVIFYETSGCGSNEPYYPINTENNLRLLRKYRELVKREQVIFGGRLGDYAYYDMDKTMLAALECFKNEIYPQDK